MIASTMFYDRTTPYVECFEEYCNWRGNYIAVVRRIIQSHLNYHVYHHFPRFPRGRYSECFTDEVRDNNFTILLSGCFRWLINICSDHEEEEGDDRGTLPLLLWPHQGVYPAQNVQGESFLSSTWKKEATLFINCDTNS